MADTEALQELAAQLRQPSGSKGLEVAEMMHDSNIGMTLHAIDRLPLTANYTVLELGHGSAAHLPALFSKAAVQYYGLEMSELMHHEAQKTGRQLPLSITQFYLYNGDTIPFASDFFDGAFTVNTLYFWTRPLQLLNELHRVLKPGGLLNITFAQKNFMEQLPFVQFGFELYDTEKLKSLVALSAFDIVQAADATEQVKTKNGDLVSRDFTTLTLIK